VPPHRLAGLCPVRGLDRVHGGRLLVAQAVEGFELAPVEDQGERLFRVGCDVARGPDQPLRPPVMSEVDIGERF